MKENYIFSLIFLIFYVLYKNKCQVIESKYFQVITYIEYVPFNINNNPSSEHHIVELRWYNKPNVPVTAADYNNNKWTYSHARPIAAPHILIPFFTRLEDDLLLVYNHYIPSFDGFVKDKFLVAFDYSNPVLCSDKNGDSVNDEVKLYLKYKLFSCEFSANKFYNTLTSPFRVLLSKDSILKSFGSVKTDLNFDNVEDFFGEYSDFIVGKDSTLFKCLGLPEEV